MIISTSDTDALVLGSVDLNIVWPVRFWGLPVGVIKSATITSRRINSASDGFIKLPSKSIIHQNRLISSLDVVE